MIYIFRSNVLRLNFVISRCSYKDTSSASCQIFCVYITSIDRFLIIVKFIFTSSHNVHSKAGSVYSSFYTGRISKQTGISPISSTKPPFGAPFSSRRLYPKVSVTFFGRRIEEKICCVCTSTELQFMSSAVWRQQIREDRHLYDRSGDSQGQRYRTALWRR